MGKESKIVKAVKAKARLKQKTTQKATKIRTKLRFTRPKTKRIQKRGKTLSHLSKEIKRREFKQWNVYDVLVHPVNSDKSVFKMENENTLTYIVNQKANKVQIRNAFEQLFKKKVRKVNTLNLSNGKKKAYITL